jgi:hypothetical protein
MISFFLGKFRKSAVWVKRGIMVAPFHCVVIHDAQFYSLHNLMIPHGGIKIPRFEKFLRIKKKVCR